MTLEEQNIMLILNQKINKLEDNLARTRAEFETVIEKKQLEVLKIREELNIAEIEWDKYIQSLEEECENLSEYNRLLIERVKDLETELQYKQKILMRGDGCYNFYIDMDTEKVLDFWKD